MSISIGGHWDDAKTCEGADNPDESGILTQDGKILIRPGSEQIIYYPIGFVSPPNLELEDGSHYCDTVEQKEGYFRVRFHTGFWTSQESLTWKARGVRCPPPPTAPPAVEM